MVYETPKYICLLKDNWLGIQIESGVERYAESVGDRSLFLPVGPNFKELEDVLIGQKWVRGIVAFAYNNRLIGVVERSGVPAINVSANVIPKTFPNVLNDENGIGRAAASHLIECGASHIVHLMVTGPILEAFRAQRLEGCRSICQESGITFSTLHMIWAGARDYIWNQEVIIEEIRQWLASQTSHVSVVADSVRASKLILQAALRLGYEPGREFALIQLGDPREERMVNPLRITYIPHDWKGVGYLAAKTLHEKVSLGIEAPAMQLVGPGVICLTRSSDPSYGSDLHKRVLAYLKNSNDYAITINEIAAAMGVSHSTLYRDYSKRSQRSLKKDLVERKLQHAQTLLSSTDLTIAEIASRCGYSNAHNFSAAFKMKYGWAPAAWRKRL